MKNSQFHSIFKLLTFLKSIKATISINRKNSALNISTNSLAASISSFSISKCIAIKRTLILLPSETFIRLERSQGTSQVSKAIHLPLNSYLQKIRLVKKKKMQMLVLLRFLSKLLLIYSLIIANTTNRWYRIETKRPNRSIKQIIISITHPCISDKKRKLYSRKHQEPFLIRNLRT